MALTLSLDFTVTAAAQQYGTAATADSQRGIIATRQLVQAVSVLTRSSGHLIYEVAGGESVAVNLGSGTLPKFVYVETDRAIKVRLGAVDGEQIDVAPLTDDIPGVLIKTGAFVGLWIENTGVEAAEVAIISAGLE